MRYDIQNGHALLNRLSVFHDYLNHLDESSTPEPIRIQHTIDLLEIIASPYAFKYDRYTAPESFTNDNALPLKAVDTPVSNLIDKTWHQLMKTHGYTKPQPLIDHHDLPINDLIEITKHPDQWVQWYQNQVQPIPWPTFKTQLQQAFNPRLIAQLIQHEPKPQSQTVPRQANPSRPLHYHFQSMTDYLAQPHHERSKPNENSIL